MIHLLEKCCQAPSRLFDLAARIAWRAHRDESGATLTEFIITLPIFVLVFHGVIILGEFTRKGSEAPIKAYEKTFEEALVFQHDFFAFDWNSHPTTASGDAINQLVSESPPHNESGGLEATATVTEGAAYGGLGWNGHMGESYARTEAVAKVPGTKVEGCEGIEEPDANDCTRLDGSGDDDRLTRQLDDDHIVGDSEYAFDLLYDGAISGDMSTEGGVFGALNSVLTELGIRPALAAGIRYGTVTGSHSDSYSFAGQSMDMNAYFNTLVPPGTQGGSHGPRVDALRATAVSRLTMQGHQHYGDLIGIAWSQPLDSESIDNVEEYP